MRAPFSAIFSASFPLSLLPPPRRSLFFSWSTKGIIRFPSTPLPPASPALIFRPKLISRFFFHPLSLSLPPTSTSFLIRRCLARLNRLRGLGSGGAGRGCFSRGELGLNSVKCLVKPINATFDFSLLFLSSLPRRWTNSASTSTATCRGWARRRSTRWSSTTWPNWWVLLRPSPLSKGHFHLRVLFI